MLVVRGVQEVGFTQQHREKFELLIIKVTQPHRITLEPDCENASAVFLNAAQIIARSLSKCG